MAHNSHDTRFSDASSFDEICKNCGATDAWGTGTLHLPCPAAPKETATEDKKQLSEKPYAGE